MKMPHEHSMLCKLSFLPVHMRQAAVLKAPTQDLHQHCDSSCKASQGISSLQWLHLCPPDKVRHVSNVHTDPVVPTR